MAITRETAVKLIAFIKEEKPEVWEAVTKSDPHTEEEWPDHLVELEKKAPFVFVPILESMKKKEEK